MNIPIRRTEQLDELWREGLLADSTYVRTLVFDGMSPAEASARLKKLKEEPACSTAAPPMADPITASPSTTVYRR